jgi:hypothetical protein
VINCVRRISPSKLKVTCCVREIGQGSNDRFHSIASNDRHLIFCFLAHIARMISSMLKPTVIRVRKRMRGHPNWGKFLRAVPTLRTEFEKQVACLGLAKSEYMSSAELRL